MKPNTNYTQPEPELELIKASEITPTEVEWLWYPYIPFGKVTILEGDPGDGKSKLLLALSAILTKGEPLPFVGEEEVHEPMTVIYQTTEDAADDTVVPRFIASNGDRNNLIFINEDKKHLTFGDSRLAQAIKQTGAKLLILDPLSSYIGEDCSLNAANEMRTQFNHLIETAREEHCAVVVVHHMNKNATTPLNRTNGSVDIAGAARSILAVTRTPNKANPQERIMVQVKSNLAPTGSAILFEVAEQGVDFIDEVEMTADEAFSAIAPKMGRPSEKSDAATDFILSLLRGGKLPATECEQQLKAAGFKKSTIKKAKRNAGVSSVKEGFTWYWTLEENVPEQPIFTADDDLPFE